MLQKMDIDGRPASVMFMTDDFVPVDPELATMVKAHFLDAKGGVAFFALAPKGEEEKEPSVRERREEEERKAEREARLRSQFARERARAEGLLGKKVDFIQDPATGRFQGSHPQGGGDGSGDKNETKPSSSVHAKDKTSASSLLRIPTNLTADDIVRKVPGAEAEVRSARAKVSSAQPTSTDNLVSAGGHRLPGGGWTPARQLIHRRIERDILTKDAVANATPAPGEQPVLYILGGRGGSGKSWFTENEKGPLFGVREKALYMNNDDIKEQLPEWKGWNAGQVHEESSEIGKEIESRALAQGLNVIIDATLQSKNSTDKRIDAFKKAGYRIEGYYMYASPATATERAVGRFVRGQQKNGMGRFVPPELPLSSVSNEDNFDSNRDKMDHWAVYDNDSPDFIPTLHSSKLRSEKSVQLISQWSREKARARELLERGDFIRDPVTGEFQGSHPGPGHGSGEGSSKESGKEDGKSPVKNFKPGVKATNTKDAGKVRDEEWVPQSPIKSMDDIMKAAPIAQKNLVSAGNKIAGDLGASFKDPGPKTRDQNGIDRIKEKIDKYKGVAGRVSDIYRGAFVVNKPSDVDEVIKRLGETHEVAAEDHRTIPSSNYTDKALMVRDRETGAIGEIQVMDKRMWDAKKAATKIYKGVRHLPDDDPAKIAGEQKMRDIYGAVLDQYQKDDWKSWDGRRRR